MKVTSLLLGAVLLCGGLAFGHDMKGMVGKGGEEKDSVVTGEIVDLACYMGHEASGGKHSMCAKQCIKGGSPMGLKGENGDVWLLVNSHEQEKAYTAAKELAGSKAKITGHLTHKGGLNALIVEKAEKAS